MDYRFADRKDIRLLVSKRMEFLEVDEKNSDYEELEANCFLYFKKAMQEKECDIVLAEEDGMCVGTGIIFYYDSVPSVFNITGKNAYITSMYVQPEYRRIGIAQKILYKLIKAAYEKEYKIIMLNASEMGKPLYKKMGFVESKNGMILTNFSN